MKSKPDSGPEAISAGPSEAANIALPGGLAAGSQRHFCFVLIPGFSLLAVAGAIDVLRAANLGADSAVYTWQLLGSDTAASNVNSSSGIGLEVSHIDKTDPASLKDGAVVAICGGDRSHSFSDAGLTRWLKNASRHDVHLGSISDGAFVVANCGLFFAHRSTIHWKCLDAYRSRYPDLDIRATMVEIDRRRFSCAGGTASLDLFLHFVHSDFGADRVASISNTYFHDALRDSSISQNVMQTYRYATKSKALAEALRIMTIHIEQPIGIEQLAKQAGTTHRSLDRLFTRHIGISPSRYYRELRLNRAASLLEQTSLPVSQIAMASGFNTSSHLGQYFRKTYHQTPLEFRESKTR